MAQTTMVAIASADGQTQILNDHCEIALGRAQADVVGQPVWEVLACQEWVPAVRTGVLEAAAGRVVPNELGVWRGAGGHQLKVRWGYSTLHDAAGRIHAVAITGTQLPALMPMPAEEAAIDFPDADFRRIFQSLPGQHLLLATDLTILDASQSYLRATMVARSEIVGRHLFDVFPDNPGDPNAAGVANLRSSLLRVIALRQPDPMPFQRYDVRRPGGMFETRYWSPLNTPVLRPDGGVGWILHTVEDVTELVVSQRQEAERISFDREQQRMVDRLREANRELDERYRERSVLQSELAHVSRLTELGQTLSTLAHEVRQPLTSIAVFLSAGTRLLDLGEIADVKHAICQAKAQTERAIQIMQRVQDFARHGTSQKRPELLQQVIDEACALALIGACAPDLELRIDLQPEVDRVMIEKIQIQQVLVNLIRNAIQAMSVTTGASLEISAMREPDGTQARVSVADNGPGILPEVRSRLFQPFVTSKPQGLGMGLSICRMLIEAHDGRLWAEDRPGGGTAFHMTLPLAQKGA